MAIHKNISNIILLIITFISFETLKIVVVVSVETLQFFRKKTHTHHPYVFVHGKNCAKIKCKMVYKISTFFAEILHKTPLCVEKQSLKIPKVCFTNKIREF